MSAAIRVKRDRGRSWGFVDWLPLVIDFGYLRFNRWWWHNLNARFALVYRLHYGEWPLYREWDKTRHNEFGAETYCPRCGLDDCTCLAGCPPPESSQG